jgi:phytoene desaturase
MQRKKAIIIGSGIGGLSLGIRLQSLGFDTVIFEKLDGPGGRAYTKRVDGFTFDMGPTVITVPHFIEELFSLERDAANLTGPDFPPEILGEGKRITSGISGGPNTSRYVKIVPIVPFYRIFFEDGTYFDYDGDPAHTREQIRKLAPEDLEGYERYHQAARDIFERGFLKLGYTYFGDPVTMAKVVPDLLKLDAVRTLYSFIKKYFKNPKTRQLFSFETLLVGGNPMSVPAIYAMIHFVEKTWGIHFAEGGTGALIKGFVKKFEELGGEIRYNSEVARISVSSPGGGEPNGPFSKKVANGITLADGTFHKADLVISNGDYANTYMRLIDSKYRLVNSDVRVKVGRQSMTQVVIYFGYKSDERDTRVRHHNIIFSPKYEELLTDIFKRKVLADDFSHYVHLPTYSDPNLAPPGHQAAYTLIPVPHNGSKLNWSELAEPFVDKALTYLDESGYFPDLRQRLVHKSYITPDYFEHHLNSYLGNGYGYEPILVQTAFLRPHNRSEDIGNLYLVGAGTQPGAGTPSVMMSAKITARLIAKDFGVDSRIVSGVPQLVKAL